MKGWAYYFADGSPIVVVWGPDSREAADKKLPELLREQGMIGWLEMIEAGSELQVETLEVEKNRTQETMPQRKEYHV